MRLKMLAKTAKIWINVLLGKLFFQRKRFVYVALGDSTVEGVGASSPAKSFPSLVFSAIKHELKHSEYYNFGKSGAKISDVLKTQAEQAIALHPDLITLSVGFNDLAQKTSLSEFEKDFSSLMNILSKKTSAFIVVNNIPDISLATIPFYKKLLGQLVIARFNKKIKRLVLGIGGLFVDVHAHSKLLRGYKGLVSEDGLHPSDLGHMFWGSAIIPHVQNILKNKSNSFVQLAI